MSHTFSGFVFSHPTTTFIYYSMATPTLATPEKVHAAPKTEVKHKSGDHLLEYPLVRDCHDAVALSTLGKPATEALCHVYAKTKNTQPFKFFYDHGDKSCEACLDHVDAWAPSLKTMECHDLTDPIVRPIEATHLAFVKSVVQPVLQKTNDVRLAVNSYLQDKDGKCFVASVTQPVMKPCNSVLTSFTGKVKQLHSSKGESKTADFSKVGKVFLFVKAKRAGSALAKVDETAEEAGEASEGQAEEAAEGEEGPLGSEAAPKKAVTETATI